MRSRRKSGDDARSDWGEWVGGGVVCGVDCSAHMSP